MTLHRSQPGPIDPDMSRRDFLRLLGASTALAGAACTRPPAEEILPYSRQPKGLVPGVPRWYATALELDGYATGLLVESREGRPVKVEGNPDHPASLGASGVFEQASILQLYDPQRARAALHRGTPRPIQALDELLTPRNEGRGLHVLLEPTGSPTVAALLRRLQERNPQARVHFDSALAHRHALRGAGGEAIEARYLLNEAEVVVSFDADILAAGPFSLRYARDFADRRRSRNPNRLYAVEPALTVTGASADHHFSHRPSELEGLLRALLAELVRLSGSDVPEPARGALAGMQAPQNAPWIPAVARDLLAHRGRSLVVAGRQLGEATQGLAHLANVVLGNAGRTVTYGVSPLVGAAEDGLSGLARSIRDGEVDRLVILGGNPVYSAPADMELGSLLTAVPHSVYLGLFVDETARHVEWFVPARHPFERWGDATALDGTLSIVQPLIEPLYDGRTETELLARLVGEGNRSAYDLVREHWMPRLTPTEDDWKSVLQRGVVDGSSLPAMQPVANWSLAQPRTDARSAPIELDWRESPSIHDGRFANNAWLLELPDPITKLTWGNAAQMSPRTAERLGVSSGRVVRLKRGGRRIELPVLVAPGQADDVVSVALGYGRELSGGRFEALANGVGANAFRLRTSDVDGSWAGVEVEVLNRTEPLAITQEHGSMHDRPIALETTVAAMKPVTKRSLPTLYDAFDASAPNQWGMAIDLSVCTGCSACVVACQAENNIPVVGKAGVLKNREMHWLRIDRYFTGPADAPRVVMQPMLCQHCEKAPCEYVCPVNATTHSPDGLNEMTYNRCVGTRFCSNNCPYKVRRFNFFDYNAHKPPVLQLAMNPEVTVRARGVMEKCTFCVQRIRTAEIAAQRERRPMPAIQTACQQACPTRAIVFGNLRDESSEVARLSRDQRAYRVLDELGTQPRIRYLVRVRNPNPELG